MISSGLELSSIRYAKFEMKNGEIARARNRYERAVDKLADEFAKVWLLTARFELRRLNLSGARAVLGNAIGIAPKDKVSWATLNWCVSMEEWLNMESRFGDLGDNELVRVKLPKKLKKRRQIEIDEESLLFKLENQSMDYKLRITNDYVRAVGLGSQGTQYLYFPVSSSSLRVRG